MENFDVKNNVNPFLVKGALIVIENEICKIVDMDSESIFALDKNGENKTISNKEWEPIELNESWLKKFGFEKGSKIKNTSTNVDWVIKTTGNIYYITIHNDNAYGDNPVIGLKYVHDLQEWFFRLTKENLNYIEI
ncbi:hypothetical protein [Changchengzhania lutea]|uniref:hypothetical protein n=1 Tax=Changchengzhania lutea TaxID=2049305 RepID=UPI00115CB0E8|nr:hypothetical protein [Changchengzhania lutea]